MSTSPLWKKGKYFALLWIGVWACESLAQVPCGSQYGNVSKPRPQARRPGSVSTGDEYSEKAQVAQLRLQSQGGGAKPSELRGIANLRRLSAGAYDQIGQGARADEQYRLAAAQFEKAGDEAFFAYEQKTAVQEYWERKLDAFENYVLAGMEGDAKRVLSELKEGASQSLARARDVDRSSVAGRDHILNRQMHLSRSAAQSVAELTEDASLAISSLQRSNGSVARSSDSEIIAMLKKNGRIEEVGKIKEGSPEIRAIRERYETLSDRLLRVQRQLFPR